MKENKVELDLNELEGVSGGADNQVKWECNVCHNTQYTQGSMPAKKGCLNNGSHAWTIKTD